MCAPCYEALELNVGARCSRCDLPEVGGASASERFCAKCAAAAPPYVALRAPFVYGGAVAELIVAAKFRRREDLAAALGRMVALDDEARQLAAGAVALVPIPLGRRRRRQRGYNQSAILARVLGKAWGLPVRYLLHRTRNTLPQSDLPLAERAANVQGAFALRRQNPTPGGKWLLVDDVVTSGETIAAAAAALGQAAEVAVIAAARAS